jgi:hypothetical protein
MTKKIPIKTIEITRVEGLITDSFQKVTVTSFAAANSELTWMARTAPAVGYDKVDFRITWQDEQFYEGRYELTENMSADLGKHVLTFCSVHGGRLRPERLTLEEYDRILQFLGDKVKAFADLLDQYSLED